MMKRLILLSIFLPFAAMAQDTESERVIRKGLLSVKGTFAVGLPTAYEGVNMYVSGNCEYYPEDQVSFRGGLWFFLGTTGTNDVLANNSTLFTDFFYHIKTKNGLDPYIGIGPGISWTQLKKPTDSAAEPFPYNLSAYRSTASPVASITTGLNYYTSKWSHLFIEARYVYGTHVSDVPGVSLSEFRIAFGYGFNISTIKKKG